MFFSFFFFAIHSCFWFNLWLLLLYFKAGPGYDPRNTSRWRARRGRSRWHTWAQTCSWRWGSRWRPSLACRICVKETCTRTTTCWMKPSSYWNLRNEPGFFLAEMKGLSLRWMMFLVCYVSGKWNLWETNDYILLQLMNSTVTVLQM